MRGVLLSVCGVALSITSLAGLATAGDTEMSVGVRIYNYAAVPAASLTAARKAADLAFGNTGIALRWLDCRVPGSGNAGWTIGADCDEPVEEGREFIVRVVERVPANLKDADRVLTLGTSMLDRSTRGGVLITVDLFPVRLIAERAASDPSTLLGRSIAHELGHLLLGRAEHPRSGLMRAFWSQDELRGVRPADWRFSPGEAARMRQGLRSRARAAN
jgi:hypothetical protein